MVIRVLQRGSMAWISPRWWLDTLVKASAQGGACALMWCERDSCVRGRLLRMSHMSKEIPHREFEKKGHGI